MFLGGLGAIAASLLLSVVANALWPDRLERRLVCVAVSALFAFLSFSMLIAGAIKMIETGDSSLVADVAPTLLRATFLIFPCWVTVNFGTLKKAYAFICGQR